MRWKRNTAPREAKPATPTQRTMGAVSRALSRLLLVLLVLCIAYQAWIFVRVVWWNWFNPGQTSFMSLRLAELRKQDPKAKLQHTWLPYPAISVQLKRAVVAAEDDRFLDHEGFDWDGMEQALEKNQRRGKTVAGGSTISQQLAKNLFLSPRRSYLRKAEEAVITVMIEAVWDKRRILEVYLNVVEWADSGVFGAEAAARHYYGIDASRLNANQAAHLAVLLPNPRKYGRNFTPRLAAHAQRILGRMGASQVP